MDTIKTTVTSDAHLQEVNEEIYKRNLELAVVNKTLSLLRKLYDISLLSLDPATLSEKLSEPVRVDLNMEAVGIMLFNQETDELQPFKFSQSVRLTETLTNLGFDFSALKINELSKKTVLREVVIGKTSAIVHNLNDIWSHIIDAEKLKTAAEKAHLKTIFLYPLLTENKTIGMLLLGLNRDFSSLSNFEKDSIKSCVNVIAVALDKALLYEALKVANEQLRILDKARAEFITIASHQLRTPPATIKWYLSSVLAGDYGKLEEQTKEIVAKANRTNNAQISLIDDMLNASRIERGKMEFLFAPADLLDLTKITIEQLEPMAKDKGLKLTFNEPKEKLPRIMADKEKVRQVMNNFIDNSLKYTKEGSVTVDLSTTPDEIKFSVTDTGKGMSPETIKTVFDKYSRGKDSAMQSSGLGLGLYVAKVIVEMHKGKAWAESPGEGKGSSFIFSLPINNGLKETTLLDLTKN